ncbi:MAG: hypothetical protein EOO23_02765 [Comamonadaceae bacterium]|nr:MAG: hypothetical protein EOO23_02765 [Comamonadaceae bacterium]
MQADTKSAIQAAREKWDAQADDMNEWHALGDDERVELAMAELSSRAASPLPVALPAQKLQRWRLSKKFDTMQRDETGAYYDADEVNAYLATLDTSTTAAAPTNAEPDESKPTSRRDLERVLTEWNDTTGALPTRGGWIHEVLGMMQDAWDVASAQAVPPVAPLDLSEQKAALKNPVIIAALIDQHDCWMTEADAFDMSECVPAHEARVLELLTLGRAIIAKDPEIWTDDVKANFKQRYSEKDSAALKSNAS